MRNLFPTHWFGVVSVVLFLAFNAVAQQGTLGAVAGTIRDTSGAVVSGAKISLKNVGTNETRSTTSTSEGAFVFNQINNGTYTVTIEKDGFAIQTFNDVVVLPAQQYSLNANLKVGAATETMEVIAGQDLIHTTTSEITNTVDQNQILNLPLLGRNPIELIRNQAGVPGVLSAARNNTGINGGRPGWTQVTQDGINIQDNFIRNNDLDFVPNRPTSDTIAEFSIITNNVGADSVGGTSQVKLVTPSGTNAYHGAVYEYNRNNYFSANSYFNKHVQPGTPVTPRPFLNQNQFGARIGGPVLRDKLFFFASYEGFRLRNGVTQRVVVPARDNYLTGNFSYVPSSGGAPVTFNVLNLINTRPGIPAPLAIDSQIQSYVLTKIRPAAQGNSFNCGDSISTRILNTTCFQYNQGHTTNRDQAAARIDYNLTSKHNFQAIVQRFTDFDQRTDIDTVDAIPNAFIPTKTRLYAGAWRWTITPTLLNEFRAGDNTSVVPFQTQYGVPPFLFVQTINNVANNNGTGLLNGLLLQNPNDNFAPQGRFVTTRHYSDNATWVKGNHNIAFGISYQGIRPHPYNFAAIMPQITFGFTSAPGAATGAYVLASANLPAPASQSTVTAINNYAAFLSGWITSATRTFQTKDLGTGFVPGYQSFRAFDYSILSPYVQDSWRVLANLTLIAGLKWEYWSPIEESHSLALLPNINGNDIRGSLLSPTGSVVPHKHFWNPDYKTFAPNVGFAWTPFKDGKTVVRGGYSLAYVNEDEVTAAQNAIVGNFGLSAAVTLNNLQQGFASGVPVIPTPTFITNRTFSQQIQDAPLGAGVTAAVFGIQPNLRTPLVHEINLSLERQLPWDMAVEGRYVGTLGRQLWRGVDYNQVKAGNNPAFLADFLRARSNLFNCGAIVPSATCAQGQPLTFLPTITNTGAGGPGGIGGPGGVGPGPNSTVLSSITSGEIGALADFYVLNRSVFPTAPSLFLPNPTIYAADGLINGSHLDYHALQLEARRRMRNGLGAQLNYTFSKSLADSQGTSQQRFEPFIDNGNHSLDYGRSEFDFTHIVNSNLIYELPFGRGKRWLSNTNGLVERIAGGWSTGHIVRWQSGSPFSILSGRGTFNRVGRSAGETAFTTLSRDQLKHLIHFKNVNGTLYWLDPSVINPATGQAVGSDSLTYSPSPSFPGQVFFNPLPGQTGNMQRLQFDGPSNYTWDMSVAKRTRVTERFDTEFRADIFNVLNQATFFFGDTNINSSRFGQITTQGNARRITQFSLRVTF